MKELHRLVEGFFKDPEKTRLWFKLPNPLLGDLSPNKMIRLGRYKKLLKFVKQSLADNAVPDGTGERT